MKNQQPLTDAELAQLESDVAVKLAAARTLQEPEHVQRLGRMQRALAELKVRRQLRKDGQR